MNSTASSQHPPKVIIHRLYTPVSPHCQSRRPSALRRTAWLLTATAALLAGIQIL